MSLSYGPALSKEAFFAVLRDARELAPIREDKYEGIWALMQQDGSVLLERAVEMIDIVAKRREEMNPLDTHLSEENSNCELVAQLRQVSEQVFAEIHVFKVLYEEIQECKEISLT